ncbi:hypothetical protein BZG36_04526 [Bifiguratus adelaidae]|uniref:Aldehyde dehydrogenase n=1 Tax=Bifiguratus adelaidae TaxID=1938954 RepID=A0A261XXY1_9FUNG|nr:hypothetical protein BZG36_04526 [Bifiguratus adelaidae]
MDTLQIRSEPLGVVLVIGSWNYPVNLLLTPVVGAIAAGNCVIMKPSEVAANIAQVITDLVPKYLDQRCYRVINGGAKEMGLVLEQRYDHILYTGSGNVGKVIAGAAAKHLTPVTLELGGKSPVVISNDSDLKITANRIAWGKFVNAGQTCIAPDYVLMPSAKIPEFTAALQKSIQRMYGTDASKSPDYCRIIHERHWERINALLTTTKGEVVFGGNANKDDLYVSPTIVVKPDVSDEIMKEEIFGPILPIVPCETAEEAIRFVNERDTPLALYVFSKDKHFSKKILDNTNSGGAVVNDVIMHFVESCLPFGGCGPSGQGAYHGDKSFETFSHQRSTMIKQQNMEAVNKIKYPPYNEDKAKVVQMFTASPPNFGKSWGVGYVTSSLHKAVGLMSSDDAVPAEKKQ